MAKPNYQFEKRKRDMDKRAKKEEKNRRKLDKTTPAPSDNPSEATAKVESSPP
ncbi:MAG: hypothetical protein QOE70_2811 [Chthoniobacter sp.]|nr:hypothetical protein [Chthoniobacter sp.]